MIRITPTIAIDESELEFSFVRSSGPGGQNVNKVSTAVQLRFDAGRCAALSDTVLARLRRLAGRRITGDDIVVIDARRYRTRERNREDAIARLVTLIRRATQKPRARRKTAPTAASREKRLEEKRRRARVKKARRPVKSDEE